MANFLQRKLIVKGEESDRQDGKLPACSHTFTCTSFEDWLFVSEARMKDETDIKQGKSPWYQGRMNRYIAEENLSKSAKFDGTFLVRESDALSVRQEPVYVISVLKDGETHHVEVERRPDGKFSLAYIEGSRAFKSLKKLVDHYRAKPIDLEGGGQAKLKYTLSD